MRVQEVSLEAYESILDDIPRLQKAILTEFIWAGEDGLTCDEVELQLYLRHQTASARVRELAQKGHIKDSGERRATRSGRTAIVWVAVEPGKEEQEKLF